MAVSSSDVQSAMIASISSRRHDRLVAPVEHRPPVRSSLIEKRRPSLDSPSCLQESSKEGTQRPLFQYCQCAPDQERDFSSQETAERWRQDFTPQALSSATSSSRESGEGMKLLMLAMEREQLTKGRMHLAEAMHLAHVLNRTMVLSPVGDSRIGFDRNLRMCTYFDTTKLGEFVNWVSNSVALPVLEENLKQQSQWVGGPLGDGSERKQHQQRPLSVLPIMLIKRGQSCDASVWSKLEPKGGADQHPLSSWLKGALAAGLAICVRERGTKETQIATRQLMQAMSTDQVRRADVLLVFKEGDLMYFQPHVMQAAEEHVVFAPHLQEAARQLVHSALRPSADKGGEGGVVRYVAVQWRTEYALLQSRMDHSRMMHCADGMIRLVSSKLKELRTSIVFLAADLSQNGESSSSTFHTLPKHLQKAAQDAIQKVYKELKPKSWSSLEPLFTSLDNGVQGILDKLMCHQATVFVFAPRSCGGKASSFTRAIIGARKATPGRWPYYEWRLPSM